MFVPLQHADIIKQLAQSFQPQQGQIIQSAFSSNTQCGSITDVAINTRGHGMRCITNIIETDSIRLDL